MVQFKTNYVEALTIFQHYIKGLNGSASLLDLRLINKFMKKLKEEVLLPTEETMKKVHEDYLKVTNEMSSLDEKKDKGKRDELKKKLDDFDKQFKELQNSDLTVEVMSEQLQTFKQIFEKAKLSELRGSDRERSAAFDNNALLCFDSFLEKIDEVMEK